MRSRPRFAARVAAVLLIAVACSARADSAAPPPASLGVRISAESLAGTYSTDAAARDACAISVLGDGVVKLVTTRFVGAGLFDEQDLWAVLRSADGSVVRAPGGAPAWVHAVPVAESRLAITRWVGPAPTDVAKEVWTRIDVPDLKPGPSPPVRITAGAVTSAASGTVSLEPGLPGPDDPVSVEIPPETIDKVQPQYPDAARRARIQGTVMVKALVDRDGLVRDVRVTHSIPELDPYAIAAVKQWRFKPARNKGGPVAVWVSIPIGFRLQ